MSCPDWFDLVGRRKAHRILAYKIPLAKKEVARFIPGSSGHEKALGRLRSLQAEFMDEMLSPLDHLREAD